jgi:hypothetical protein
MSEICGSCGKISGTKLPNAAIQPLLDELAYQNPETLARALRGGEIVLVQCRANVGGLVGTDLRILIVKNGEAHELSYEDVEDIKIEKVGWFLDATCQLVTKKSPYQKIKSKAADASPTAVSLIRLYMPTFVLARVRIFDIRDSRRCRNCGAFVRLGASDWVGIERGQLMEPIPNGGAEVLGANLEPGERILCQAHGARFHKSVIVSDRRVMFVQGRAPNRFRAFALASIDRVEVDGEGLQLRLKDKPFQKLGSAALVGADTGMPSNEGDVTTLRQVAEVVERVKAGA